MIDKISGYLVPLYAMTIEKDPTAKRTFLIESFGRFIEFESTEVFLQKQAANGVDIDKLNKKVDPNDGLISRGIEGINNHFSNKKFKNMAAKLLHDNPYAEHMLRQYIEKLENYNLSEKQIDNRLDIVKDLNSIGRLLQADPYSDSQFSKEVLSKVITWGFDGVKDDRGLTEKINLLRKSLTHAVDKDLIRDFISKDMSKHDDSQKLIELIVVAEKSKENKCTILTSTSAFTTVAALGLKAGLAQEQFDAIREGLGALPEVATNLINTLQASPWGHVFVAAGAFVIAAQAISEGNKKFKEYLRDKQIRYATPEKNNYDATNKLLTNNIMAGILLKSPYDLSDQQSKQYLILSSFLIEKTKNPSFIVSNDLKRDLGITNAQMEKLNKLTRDDIHEIYFINNPEIRKFLILNDVSGKEKNTLKQISLIEEAAEINTNYNGKLFKDIFTINGLDKDFKDKIKALTNSEKQIVESFLNLHRDRDNNVDLEKINLFKDNLPINNVCKIVDSQISNIKAEVMKKQKEEDEKNHVLVYFKRLQSMPGALWDSVVAKTGDKEKIITINADVKDELRVINAKYGFTESQKLSDYYNNIVTESRKLKGNIMDRIAAIRTVASQSSSPSPLIP